jgi:hypothetical protein
MDVRGRRIGRVRIETTGRHRGENAGEAGEGDVSANGS